MFNDFNHARKELAAAGKYLDYDEVVENLKGETFRVALFGKPRKFVDDNARPHLIIGDPKDGRVILDSNAQDNIATYKGGTIALIDIGGENKFFSLNSLSFITKEEMRESARVAVKKAATEASEQAPAASLDDVLREFNITAEQAQKIANAVNAAQKGFQLGS
jgi:hypothetical protein